MILNGKVLESCSTNVLECAYILYVCRVQCNIEMFIFFVAQPSQGRLGIGRPTTFSLNDELKRVLLVNNNKKERIHACADPPAFQMLFSLFHNYEVCKLLWHL